MTHCAKEPNSAELPGAADFDEPQEALANSQSTWRLVAMPEKPAAAVRLHIAHMGGYVDAVQECSLSGGFFGA
jgi:hypothetical protein